MALIQCNFFSNVLRKSTSVNVLLPESRRENKEIPVLYLLHGLSDDNTGWTRRTSIERYVSEKNIAVILPDVDRSYYTNMMNGHDYFTFISTELPRIMKSFFVISDKREHTYVAGLSMGGFGAFKLALNFPERFCAAASLSGALDIESRIKREKTIYLRKELKDIFGKKDIRNSENDLFYLSEQVNISGGNKPRLYQCCGTEDFLYTDNIRFKDHMSKLDFDHTYEEETGDHTWEYWDKKIQRVIEWIL